VKFALKCICSFVHHTVQMCGRKITGRSEAVHMTMHRYHTYNFRFQLLCQKITSAYNIAAVSCNSHEQESMLSSNRFASIQGKTMSKLSDFGVSFRASPPISNLFPPISRLAPWLLHTSNTVFLKCGPSFWFLAPPAAISWRRAWCHCKISGVTEL